MTVLVALFLGTVAYALFNLFLSPKSIRETTGPQESYYWAVAQFQIALSDTERALEVGTEKSLDIEVVTLRYQILQSKYSLISVPSEATAPLYAEPEYAVKIKELAALFRETDAIADGLGAGRSARDLVVELEKMRPVATELAIHAGAAEVHQRTKLYQNFISMRNEVFCAILIAVLFTALLVAFLVAVAREQKRVIRQNGRALNAEQDAVRAANEAVRTKTAFLGAVGHELRTPLQSITAAIEVLSGSRFGSEHSATIKRLNQSALQLELQMKDLTDFARIDSRKLQLQLTKFDVVEVIQSAVAEQRDNAERKNIELSFFFEGDLGYCHSDPTRLRQVIVNLLSNAIKYTDEGAVEVRLSQRRSGATVNLELEVRDTGVGIPQDKIDLIFQPFIQVSTAHNRRRDGSGMGLAIVSGLIELLGGDINVESTPGKGSVFSVRLTFDSAVISDVSDAHPCDFVDPESDLKLLVVDDAVEIAEAFGEMLSQRGFQCETCNSGERAAQKLVRRHYDALILDIQMPGRDGISVARELRKRSGPNQRIPIIAISAYPGDLLSAEDARLFDEYLLKPVRVADLSKAISREGMNQRLKWRAKTASIT